MAVVSVASTHLAATMALYRHLVAALALCMHLDAALEVHMRLAANPALCMHLAVPLALHRHVTITPTLHIHPGAALQVHMRLVATLALNSCLATAAAARQAACPLRTQRVAGVFRPPRLLTVSKTTWMQTLWMAMEGCGRDDYEVILMAGVLYIHNGEDDTESTNLRKGRWWCIGEMINCP